MTNTNDTGTEAGEGRLSRRAVLGRSVGLGVGLTAFGGNLALARAASDSRSKDAPVDARRVTISHLWQRVALSKSYENPVAFARPLSYNGPQPATTRVRNVRPSSFELAIEEWVPQDRDHYHETVGTLVVDAGTETSSTGKQAEAGVVTADSAGTRIDFEQDFSERPVVLTQSQTEHGWQPHVIAKDGLSTDGVTIRIQEEEAQGWHKEEAVGYLAIEPGAWLQDGYLFEAGVADVDDSWTTIEFENTYENPVFLADVQTSNERDTVSMRYRNLTGSGVEVFLEEEQSADEETSHASEAVGFVVVDGPVPYRF